MFPLIAVFTSAMVGLGLRSTSAAQLITIPEVQNPHCSASCATNAACTGCKLLPCASPSTVVTLRLPTSMARVMQEHTGVLSTMTVHAEHAPRSQTIFVPVICNSSRKSSPAAPAEARPADWRKVRRVVTPSLSFLLSEGGRGGSE